MRETQARHLENSDLETFKVGPNSLFTLLKKREWPRRKTSYEPTSDSQDAQDSQFVPLLRCLKANLGTTLNVLRSDYVTRMNPICITVEVYNCA